MGSAEQRSADDDSHNSAFLVCFAITVALAVGRVLYCKTLPIAFDYNFVSVDIFLSSSLVLMSFAPIYSGSRPFVTVARSFVTITRSLAMLLLVKIGLLETVFFIYYSGRALPLADDVLARADRILGFDWIAYVGWIDAHPALIEVLDLAYQSIWWQPFVVGLMLACCHQSRRTYIMVTAKGLCLFLVGGVSMFMPAYGAYTYFGASRMTLPHLTVGDLGRMKLPIDHLRAGIFDPADLVTALVQFPSFHAAEVVMMTWAAWRTLLRWPILALNIAMLASTPVFGSHYVSDMIAGAAIGGFAILLVSSAVRFAAKATKSDLCVMRPSFIRGVDTPAIPDTRTGGWPWHDRRRSGDARRHQADRNCDGERDGAVLVCKVGPAAAAKPQPTSVEGRPERGDRHLGQCPVNASMKARSAGRIWRRLV